VTVWNRTPAAAAPLVAAGARQAATPREAAVDADFVMAMVRDDGVSRQIWLDPEQGALAGMNTNTIAIECSTLTPQWVQELGRHMAMHGLALLEAPVSGSRSQAETGQLIYLIGGDATVFDRAKPVLDATGSEMHHVGPLGHGALTKLATNTLLGIQVTALAEIIGMLQHNGADVLTVLAAIARTSVWSPVANYLASTMITRNFAPQFPIGLIEKDFGYAVAVAGTPTQVPTIAAAHSVFKQAIAQGLTEQNMTGVVNLFTAGAKA